MCNEKAITADSAKIATLLYIFGQRKLITVNILMNAFDNDSPSPELQQQQNLWP